MRKTREPVWVRVWGRKRKESSRHMCAAQAQT